MIFNKNKNHSKAIVVVPLPSFFMHSRVSKTLDQSSITTSRFFKDLYLSFGFQRHADVIGDLHLFRFEDWSSSSPGFFKNTFISSLFYYCCWFADRDSCCCCYFWWFFHGTSSRFDRRIRREASSCRVIITSLLLLQQHVWMGAFRLE